VPNDASTSQGSLFQGAAERSSNNRTDGHQHFTPSNLTPKAHHSAPPGTSEVAAASMKPHAARQQREVLAVIVATREHGATDWEVETATGIRAQSVSPRRGELRELGLIVDSGRRRPTASGRPAAVWVAAQYATKTEGGAP